MSKFNTNLRDSQSSMIAPLAPERFDFSAYSDYEATLLESNRAFAQANSGLLVYRRFRADGVFYDKCRSAEESLALQLGALKASTAYKGDIANFLEPWYGIGYIAASFGGKYVWPDGQAPAVEPLFHKVQEILDADVRPIAETEIGRHILNMTEYFLEKTHGKIPVSFTDIQSPLNMLSYLLPMNDLFVAVLDEPEELAAAAGKLTDLLIDFLRAQKALIGDCLASPGHGFASSRAFRGVGLSDDVSLMLSPDDYIDIFRPLDEKLGGIFGGTVYHSCGNWAKKIEMVKSFSGLITVDGAFSPETDPSPNDPSVFGDAFAGSGITVNARAVGSADVAFDSFRRIWRPNQKLIAVTYCETPEEQERLYNRLHALANGETEE